MMMILRDIKRSEKTLIPLLESFFVKIYRQDKLVSHGLDHHRRVWEYAKELLEYKRMDGFSFDRQFIQKLMIGCYLHDIGMAIDSGERHGRHSRELCLRFLKENGMTETEYSDLLTAIEKHDLKEYSDSGIKDLLLTLLSVADDLDAFGEEGIERYLEIYRERGVDNHLLGKAVRDNASRRFKNFDRVFGAHPDLVEKHKKRYLLLDIYFRSINNHGVTILR